MKTTATAKDLARRVGETICQGAQPFVYLPPFHGYVKVRGESLVHLLKQQPDDLLVPYEETTKDKGQLLLWVG